MQSFEQQRPGQIVAPDVVLHIQGFLSRTGQQYTRCKRIPRARQRVDTVQSGMPVQQRCQRSAEGGVSGRLLAQYLGGLTGIHFRHTPASDQHDDAQSNRQRSTQSRPAHSH